MEEIGLANVPARHSSGNQSGKVWALVECKHALTVSVSIISGIVKLLSL